jgi:hypothetical protein
MKNVVGAQLGVLHDPVLTSWQVSLLPALTYAVRGSTSRLTEAVLLTNPHGVNSTKDTLYYIVTTWDPTINTFSLDLDDISRQTSEFVSSQLRRLGLVPREVDFLNLSYATNHAFAREYALRELRGGQTNGEHTLAWLETHSASSRKSKINLNNHFIHYRRMFRD